MMMFRAISAAAAATALALLIATSSLGSTARTPSLRAAVGPTFTIKLTKSGKAVRRLAAGTYRITVADRSSQHNFVLEREGGRERVLTSVPFVGTKTVSIRLTKGVWKFYCEPHASVMVGHFAVGRAPLAHATTTTADDRGGHRELEPGDDHGGR